MSGDVVEGGEESGRGDKVGLRWSGKAEGEAMNWPGEGVDGMGKGICGSWEKEEGNVDGLAKQDLSLGEDRVVEKSVDRAESIEERSFGQDLDVLMLSLAGSDSNDSCLSECRPVELWGEESRGGM